MGVLLLLGFAWLVSRYGRPLAFTAAFAFASAIFAVDPLASALFGLAYGAAFFSAVHRVSDSVMGTILVVLAGLLLYLGIGYWVVLAR